MMTMLNQKDKRSDSEAGPKTSSNQEKDLLVWRRKLDDLKNKTVKK